jgi:diaminohydroxyphosphoribosylaminopyrimidine deaminase/5-amino-6-(5-phosphoribosylamino)uracil reductase
MATAAELVAMRRAITLSALGLGSTSPNPPVGCVILDATGHVVGEGYHRRKGEPHAEVHALAAAGERASGSTAVVTLEPCNHYGRTPACHQALIDARIARVVIASIDPTSRGAGGAARLRQAGVDVEVGVLAQEARLVFGPWLTALRTGRPQVTWPYVVAAEGLVEALSALPDAENLRRTADVVLRTDGSVHEAVPNSHGAGALSLPDGPFNADPLAALHALYQSGARTVLLDGGAELARQFLDHRLIDRVVVYASATQPASRWAPQKAGAPFLPVGFRLVAIARLERLVRVEAVAADGENG